MTFLFQLSKRRLRGERNCLDYPARWSQHLNSSPRAFRPRHCIFQFGSEARAVSHLFIFVFPTPPCLLPALQNLVEFWGVEKVKHDLTGVSRSSRPWKWLQELAKAVHSEARGPSLPFGAHSPSLSCLWERNFAHGSCLRCRLLP